MRTHLMGYEMLLQRLCTQQEANVRNSGLQAAGSYMQNRGDVQSVFYCFAHLFIFWVISCIRLLAHARPTMLCSSDTS